MYSNDEVYKKIICRGGKRLEGNTSVVTGWWDHGWPFPPQFYRLSKISMYYLWNWKTYKPYIYIYILQCGFIGEGDVNNVIPVWSCSAAVPSSASLHSAEINGNKLL